MFVRACAFHLIHLIRGFFNSALPLLLEAKLLMRSLLQAATSYLVVVNREALKLHSGDFASSSFPARQLDASLNSVRRIASRTSSS